MNRRHLLISAIALALPNAASADRLVVQESADGYLNLRQGPGTQYDIIQRIYDGMWVDVVGVDGNWHRIVLSDGTMGWASARYLGATYSYGFYLDVQIAETPDGYLNLRQGPGTNHPILQRLYPGQRLSVLEEQGYWARVQLTDGAIGWASSHFFYADS